MTPDTPDQRGQPTEQEVLVRRLRNWATAMRINAKRAKKLPRPVFEVYSNEAKAVSVVLKKAAKEIERLSRAPKL